MTTLPAGAYGFTLDGLRSRALVEPAPAGWPVVRIERRPPGPDAPAATRLDSGEVAFESGWSLRLGGSPPTAAFFLPEAVGDDELVHPHLAALARFFAHRFGYESLHGGAFVAGGGAWAVLAEREGGKSTTLAHLAGRGVPVLSDDVLVVDGENALAGPRCIDLRTEPGLGDVRGGERRRLALPQIAPAVPLRGCFLLEWGDELELRALGPAERVVALARHCLPATARRPFLLDLARLPAWRVARPRDPLGLDDVCGRLLETALR